MKKSRSTLKGYFVKGAIPTEENFADLIDSMLNQDDDGIGKTSNTDPLQIKATGTEENLINFYRVGQDGDVLTWQIEQNPGDKPGLSIGDKATSRLFIESDTGNIGIGTTTPSAKLDVIGSLFSNYMVIRRDENIKTGGKYYALQIQQPDTNPSTIPEANPSILFHHVFKYFHRIEAKSDGIHFKTGALEDDSHIKVFVGDLFVAGNVGIGITNPENSEGWSKVLDILGSAATKLSVRTTNIDARVLAHDRGWWGAPTGMILGTSTNHPVSIATNSSIKFSIDAGTGSSTLRSPGRMHLTGGELLYLLHKDGVVIGKEWGGNGNLSVQGEIRTDYIVLGNRFRMSGVGDGMGDNWWIRLTNPAGTAYQGGFAAGKLYYNTALEKSDVRMKKDISPLEHPLESLLALRGVRYKWKNSDNDRPFQMGLVAQEVEKIFPELVEVGPEGMKGINYSGLIAPLIEAVKSQQAQILKLKDEIQSLRTSKEKPA